MPESQAACCVLSCVLASTAFAGGDPCLPQWSTQFAQAGVTGTASELLIHDDGTGPQLYVAGDFSAVGGLVTPSIARFNGQLWTAVGPGLNGDVHDLASYDFGFGHRLVAGGNVNLAGSGDLVQWDGAQWSAAPGSTPIFTSWIASFGQYQGQFFVSTPVVHSGLNYIGRWTGAAWTGVAQGLASVVWDQLEYDDGTGGALYVAGIPFPSGVPNTHTIARWNGQTWSGLGNGLGGGEGRALAAFDDGTGSGLYVGGSFTVSMGQSAKRIARWKNGVWTQVGNGFNNTVFALQVFDDGTGPALFAGGSFTLSGSTALNHIAKWNGNAWEPLDLGITGGNVQAMSVFDDDGDGPIPPALYVVGDFTSAGGVSSPGIARWGRCAPACPADLNTSGSVDGADLGIMLGAWGPCTGQPCDGDLNSDGQIDGADLGALLGAWGECVG